MNCLYPHNTGQTAYGKGCRCDRCRAAKAAAWIPTPKPSPCRRCGDRDKQKCGWYCEPCAQAVLVDKVTSNIEIDQAMGCWLWTGNRTRGGYGVIHRHRGLKPTTTHRVMYENYHGAIPDGMHIDHLCNVRACCNPDHLEAVSRSENMKRAFARRRAFYREAA